MHPHYRGVAFLLSLGSLPLACNDKDPATTPATNTGNGPDPGTDSTTPVDPTTGPQGTTEATTVDPDTTTPSTEGTDDTGPPVFPPPTNPECQAYADHYVECYPRDADYVNMIGYYCDGYIMYGSADGMACTDAIKALFVCYSTLPCDNRDHNACNAENDAITTACPSFGGSETSDTFADTGDSSG